MSDGSFVTVVARDRSLDVRAGDYAEMFADMDAQARSRHGTSTSSTTATRAESVQYPCGGSEKPPHRRS